MTAAPRPVVSSPAGAGCRARTDVPRLALSKREAADALGVSVDYLERHILPELRVVYRGRRRLIAVAELEKWLERSAIRPAATVMETGKAA